MSLIIIPTYFGEVTFPVPEDYPVPPIGGDFYFHFESAIKDPGEWEAVRSMIENDVLTVDRIEVDAVYLREGRRPELVDTAPEEYYLTYLEYWKKNPATKPPDF
ncbi:hypothetical protein GCM10009119_19530 [Algoriphagus jejuensis]|uniref:Uncharacterized protein n=1 Tax=Algoriphagus jejuensis TaxID=419934 RepID=A0ABN1MZJ7_9BACT